MIGTSVSIHTAATGTISAAAGATTEPFSALTKCCNTCVVQLDGADLECGQHPCFCCASSTCGHEKQFPRNRAATTTTAMTEVRTVRIPCPV